MSLVFVSINFVLLLWHCTIDNNFFHILSKLFTHWMSQAVPKNDGKMGLYQVG